MNRHNFISRHFGFFIIIVLLVTFLTACQDETTPTSLPLNKITSSTTNISGGSTTTLKLTQAVSLATGSEVTNQPNDTPLVPTPTPSAQLIGPTVGDNGQITVNAPPADGKNVSGHFYWIKGGADIWVGGTGVGKPLSNSSLGGQLLQQVTSGGLQKDPMLSPDGKKLAYAYSPPPYLDANKTPIFGEDIYMLDLATKKAQLVVKRNDPEEFLEYPAWSADGQNLYFASRAPVRENGRVTGSKLLIGSYDLKTQQRQDLIQDATEPMALSDGKNLIYIGVMASDESYAYSLRTLDLQTKQSKALLTDKENFYGFRAPRPSPDGKTIVFGGIGGPDEVPVVNSANPVGNNQTAPTPTVKKPGSGLLGNFALLSFGLLGNADKATTEQRVTTMPNLHGLPYDLWEIKPSGDGLHRLTTLFEDEPIAAWSQDGKRLVFLAGNGFYSCNADGTNLTKISDEGAHGGFTWQP